MSKGFHIGHFIKEYHIAKAIELLNYQLSQDSPLYNNLDFTLYKNEDLNTINPTAFYKDYIKRDGLYYFESLFYSQRYFGIQRAYKTREFHYLSLHSLILYYSLGFYVRELLFKRLAHDEEMHAGKNINVYYGGKINFATPTESNIFYYNDYKEFLQLKEKLTTPVQGKIKYAISLDIKSFFYTINHKILVNIIDDLATPAPKKGLNYDSDAKDAILTILKYLQGGELGLPVANQNIVSSFISSVYFSSFDQFIVDKYLSEEKYHYIRYVDDFYLIFEEDENADVKEIRRRMYSIENDFGEFLMDNLELSISPSKSERYTISDTDSHRDFLHASNFDSPLDQEFEMEDVYEGSILKMDIAGKSVPEIFSECINILKGLKAQTESLSQLTLENKLSAFLNYTLILKTCVAYSKSPKAIQELEKSGIFDDLEDIDFLLIKPKVMYHLATLTKTGRLKLLGFILYCLETPGSTLQKLTLTDKFIHQMIFMISDRKGKEKEGLIEEWEEYKALLVSVLLKLSEANPYNPYLSLLLAVVIPDRGLVSHDRIYSADYLNMDNSIAIMQQIKLRRVSERTLNFNVCFNHLLNEFQNLFEQVYFNSVQHTAKEITKKMRDEGYTSAEVHFVSDFFERRNNNSISHTNDNIVGLWGVTPEEYLEYKYKILPILASIYSKIAQSAS